MTTRRTVMTGLALSATGLTLATPLQRVFAAPASSPMVMRKIPKTGEMVPVIGMGSSGSMEVGTDPAERAPLKEVLRVFFAGGGVMIDTAPSYGRAEKVLGDLIAELNLRDKAFIATKIGTSGRDAGMAQFKQSLADLRTDKVELLQVHNLRDWKTQLALINELKSQGKTRYSGLTHYLASAHDDLADAVRTGKPDVLQVNYSIISREAEKTLFPLAQDQGVGVIINRAFEDGRLFQQVKGKALPNWAAEAGITSWAQAFLRFAWSHPAVTAVIPATSRPDRQADNLQGGHGDMLTARQRQSLIDIVG